MFGNSKVTDWVSYMNDAYIKLYGPTIRIFKLNKVDTEIDDLYGEEEFGGGRLYLPPFTLKAFHLDNTWRQMLGTEAVPYTEQQENIQFVLNFDNMVRTLRNLKSRKSTELIIDYTGSYPASIEKDDKEFIIRIKDHNNTTHVLNLEHDSNITAKGLAQVINNISHFSVEYHHRPNTPDDLSINLVDFAETQFKKAKIKVFSPDRTYRNSTDVIEAGDLILTHKYHLYEVLSNMPGGNFGWDYATYVLTCNIRNIDKSQLPEDFIRQIKTNEYGLRDKFDMG